MNRIAFTVAVIAQLGIAGQAAADITRGCSGYFRIAGSGHTLTTRTANFGEIEGRGSCKNRRKANDCRKRAASYIFDCGQSAWNTRWDPDIRRAAKRPPDCYGRGNTGVRDYAPYDLKSAIERSACRMPWAPPFRVQVSVHSSGDSGCHGWRELFSAYEIKQGMC